MIAKFIFLFVGLILQEMFTLNALVFATHQGLYPPLLIHVLFLIGTIIDIVVGFYLGKFLNTKSSHSKISIYIQKVAGKFEIHTNKYKRWFALFLLGNFSFPYVNSCIAGYLGMSFWESSFFIFLGNMLYYASIWLLVLGIGIFVQKAQYGLLIGFGIILIVFLILRKIKNKVM